MSFPETDSEPASCYVLVFVVCFLEAANEFGAAGLFCQFVFLLWTTAHTIQFSSEFIPHFFRQSKSVKTFPGWIKLVRKMTQKNV